jgi:two-component system response regulator ResD
LRGGKTMDGVTSKVLIVDDDENISEVIDMYLKNI